MMALPTSSVHQHDQRPDRVGDDVAQQDAGRAEADALRGLDVFLERCTITRLRARRANFGHHTTSMAMMVLIVPMPSAAAIAIARMIGGKQQHQVGAAHQSLLPPSRRA